jgi:hypothetical protein
MSRRPGSSVQPDSVTIDPTSIEAPQAGQLNCVPSVTSPHHGHVCARVGWFGALTPKVIDQLSLKNRRQEQAAGGNRQSYDLL